MTFRYGQMAYHSVVLPFLIPPLATTMIDTAFRHCARWALPLPSRPGTHPGQDARTYLATSARLY